MAVKDVDPLVETPKTQFSIRSIIALTAAIAVWALIFGEAALAETTVLTGVALAAGIAAHFLYSFWLPWRITVMATVLLTYNSILFAHALQHSSSSDPVSDCLELLVDVVVQPTEMLMHAKTLREKMFLLAILFGTVFFTPAHSLHPSLPSALITALGIGIWYAAGILLMMYAG